MPPCRALIVLTVLALLAANARAQQTAPASSDTGLGLKLKLQETLLPPVAPGPNEELPVFLEADRLEGTQGKEVVAYGDVELRRRGEAVFADELRYLFPTQVVTATGHVRFEELGNTITGDQAYFDLNTDSGYIDHVTYHLRQYHARGEAEKVIIRDRDRVRALQATYTNCAVGDDDWYLKVKRLNLDRLRDVGDANDATLYFKQVPILYTPWIDFPLSGRRKTGLLTPVFGSSQTTGFEFAVPFYWNIAPTMDYTFTPRVMAKRGVLLGNEYRYLQPKFAGTLALDYLPDDRQTGTNRYALSLQHRQEFGYGFYGGLNIQRVSDSNYFRDLSDNIAVTSQTVLPQDLWVRYEGGWWTTSFRYQKFQTLEDPLAPTVPPYARAPQITLNASQQNVVGADLGFSGALDNFEHPSFLNGRRQVYYPYVSVPLRGDFFYITPKAGFNYTQYNYPNGELPTQVRSLPILSVDSGMEFERDTQLFGRDYVQTLDPRVYYLYIPFRNQEQLPIFDTFLKDFDFTSIFSENIFSGGDRINNANQITAAVTTQLINPNSGAELLRALIGQRYYFEPELVTLSSTAPDNPPPTVNGPPPSVTGTGTPSRSDLLAAFSGQLTRTWSVNSGLAYGVDTGQFERFDIAVRDRPEPGKVLNIGYRFTRDYLNQIDISAQWPLTHRWAGLARWNYSLQPSGLLEALVGLEYNAECWTARFLAHRFVTAPEQQTTAFFFQLELGGLSHLGTGRIDQLRQTIGGSSKPSLRPTGAEDYYPGMDEQ
ncbi:MAG TPA: LPS-assembly protein LptD [Burkholderiales bacterium]|nr:LPS-assembly protein LptD [Burkholderiales bacterium]